MPATKTRWVENETLTEVTVHTPAMWGGLRPQMHVVVYPETAFGIASRSYALTEELLNFHFTICTPQEVVLTAHGADGTDRPTPKQEQAERGDIVIPKASNIIDIQRG